MGGETAGVPPEFGGKRSSATPGLKDASLVHTPQRSAEPQCIYLTIANVPAEEWACVIEDHRKTIGRSAKAEIRIPARFTYVSRKHAEVWREKSKTFLCDIKSRTGTSLNGVWLKKGKPTQLMVGDRIWLGAVQLDVASQIPSKSELMEESNGSPVKKDEPEALPGSPTILLPVRMLLETLTPAELEIALWLGRGLFDDVEIGRMLYRSPHTVRTQVASVMRKLSLHSRHDIIGFLRRDG